MYSERTRISESALRNTQAVGTPSKILMKYPAHFPPCLGHAHVFLHSVSVAHKCPRAGAGAIGSRPCAQSAISTPAIAVSGGTRMAGPASSLGSAGAACAASPASGASLVAATFDCLSTASAMRW
jgi:hypothetical protein